MTTDENDLFRTLETEGKTATDAEFLKNLSQWIIDCYGNVNVAQRLSIIAERLRNK